MPRREPPPPPPEVRSAVGCGNDRRPARPWRPPGSGPLVGLPRSAPPDVRTLVPGNPCAPPGESRPNLQPDNRAWESPIPRERATPAGVTRPSHPDPAGGAAHPAGVVRRRPRRDDLVLVGAALGPATARGDQGAVGHRQKTTAGARPVPVTR